MIFFLKIEIFVYIKTRRTSISDIGLSLVSRIPYSHSWYNIGINSKYYYLDYRENFENSVLVMTTFINEISIFRKIIKTRGKKLVFIGRFYSMLHKLVKFDKILVVSFASFHRVTKYTFNILVCVHVVIRSKPTSLYLGSRCRYLWNLHRINSRGIKSGF